MSFQPPCVSRKELERELSGANLLTPKVRLALEYAEKAHKDQKRDQGNPYLEEHIYPIASGILERHAEDPELESIIILGILHDVLEDDPNASAEDIKRDFGKDMLDCLWLVTKKPEENMSTLPEERKRVINAKMLAGLENAPKRVQVVKLEDRLNNMSSFERMSTPRYVRMAEETRNLFIPFAARTVPLYAALLEKCLNRLEAAS